VKPSAWIEDSLYNKIKSVIPIACIDLLVVHDGRLLLMLRNNEPGKGVWFTPRRQDPERRGTGGGGDLRAGEGDGA